MLQGVFSAWQPIYADYGLSTFPVIIADSIKKPAVKYYLKIGSETSRKLAEKFPASDAFGFALGPKSRITVLDIDTPDERVLSDAITQHGPTPIVVRSGSGNYQAWYRYNGERRQIRPWHDKPIDVLGSGYVVAPPSKGARGHYEIVQGSLDDLDRLPKLAPLPGVGGGLRKGASYCGTSVAGRAVSEGARNDTLFRHCMVEARYCDTFDALLDVARTRNDELLPPLPDGEVVKIAQSAWGYTERGENRFGRPGAWFTADEANYLIKTDHDIFLLLAYLRANNGPKRSFWIANGLEHEIGIPRKRLSAARKRLVEGGYVKLVRTASKQSGPALYQWIPKGGRN
jgi:hypothetical protein